MPFTLSHPAAALPFARWRLSLSALVVGSMSPDFEYFARLRTVGEFGHTIPGLFLSCLPAGLLVLWCYHALIKWPCLSLLPNEFQARLVAPARSFRWGPWSRFILIAASVLLGAVTHLFWDGFTHHNGWAVQALPFLASPIALFGSSEVGLYKVLQHTSTLLGGLLLLVWAMTWLRRAPSHPAGGRTRRSASSRAIILTGLLSGSFVCGLANGFRLWEQGGGTRGLVVGGVVGAVSGLFLLLLLFGIVCSMRKPEANH